MGFASIEEARAAGEAARATAAANLTPDQRVVQAENEAKAAREAAQRQRSLIEEQAARMLGVLEPAQRQAIEAYAGDDPAEQLRAIQHFVPVWAASSGTGGGAPVTTQAAPAPAPAPGTPAPAPEAPTSTSPAPGAPAPGAPVSNEDPEAVYKSLSQSGNPFKRAAYGLSNPGAYGKS